MKEDEGMFFLAFLFQTRPKARQEFEDPKVENYT
jgi:hypothetical protein